VTAKWQIQLSFDPRLIRESALAAHLPDPFKKHLGMNRLRKNFEIMTIVASRLQHI
jgi:hypothetical protein